MMRKTLLTCIVFLALASAACNLPGSPGAVETPIPSPVQPTDVPTPPAPDQPSGPMASVPVVYYYFASIPGNTFPAGSVVIVPDQLILSPNLSKIARSPEPAINVEAGLQAMIDDPRNVWTSHDRRSAQRVDKRWANDQRGGLQ